MPVAHTTLSTRQISKALSICPTAATRKVTAAEAALRAAVAAEIASEHCPRADRVLSAVTHRIETLTRLADAYPDQVEHWIAAMVDDFLQAQRPGVRHEARTRR